MQNQLGDLQNIRYWTGFANLRWRLGTSTRRTYCIEIWNLKTSFWQNSIRSKSATLGSQRCWRILLIWQRLRRVHRIIFRLKSVWVNATITSQTCGCWDASFMSCAHYDVRLKENLLILCSIRSRKLLINHCLNHLNQSSINLLIFFFKKRHQSEHL